MSGIGYTFTISDLGVQATLAGIEARLANPQPALHDCGVQQIRSSHKNFAVGGRPTPWTEVSRSTRKHKQKTGHTKILIESRMLENSITSEASGDLMVTGTSSPYGRIHQKGGEIHQGARSELFTRNRYVKGKNKGGFKKGTTKGRGLTFGDRVIRIPARQFLLFLPEDIAIHEKILTYYVMGKKL